MKTIQKKLKDKKCKFCERPFTPIRPLQQICSYECSILYTKELNEKKEKKEWQKRKKIMSIDAHSQKHKKTLQNEINKLARMIDEHCNYKNCIDCGKELDYTKQIDGSHRHNVQGNENIRFNLLNIHSARSECNQHHGGRKEGYIKGLTERYGENVTEEIENLSKKYPLSKFTNKQIYESIAIVRKCQRELKNYPNNNAYVLRVVFNTKIGLYK